MLGVQVLPARGRGGLKPYSTFALSEWEETNGYTLLCRAMPEEDLVVELLHFDPTATGSRTRSATDGDGDGGRRAHQRHPPPGAAVDEPADFSFLPGQYVDLWVPGSDEARRSFSMANLPGDGRIELIIKRYPGGRFSSMLDGEIGAGDTLGFTGPTAPSTCARTHGRS